MSADFYTSWGFWITLAGSILGVAGLIYGLWVRSHPKRSVLLCRITESALVPSAAKAATGDLRVTYRDRELRDPHVAVIEVTNLGPGDLSPSAFAGGHLRFHSSRGGLGPSIIEGVLESGLGDVHVGARPDGVFVIDEAESFLEVAPLQLKARETFTTTLLVTHRPDLGVGARLADFEVKEVRGPKPQEIEFQIDFLGIPIRAKMRTKPR